MMTISITEKKTFQAVIFMLLIKRAPHKNGFCQFFTLFGLTSPQVAVYKSIASENKKGDYISFCFVTFMSANQWRPESVSCRKQKEIHEFVCTYSAVDTVPATEKADIESAEKDDRHHIGKLIHRLFEKSIYKGGELFNKIDPRETMQNGKKPFDKKLLDSNRKERAVSGKLSQERCYCPSLLFDLLLTTKTIMHHRWSSLIQQIDLIQAEIKDRKDDFHDRLKSRNISLPRLTCCACSLIGVTDEAHVTDAHIVNADGVHQSLPTVRVIGTH